MTITRLIDFPTTKVKGCSVIDEDGNQNIYINSRFNAESQKETAEHELKHGLLDLPSIQLLESLLHK